MPFGLLPSLPFFNRPPWALLPLLRMGRAHTGDHKWVKTMTTKSGQTASRKGASAPSASLSSKFRAVGAGSSSNYHAWTADDLKKPDTSIRAACAKAIFKEWDNGQLTLTLLPLQFEGTVDGEGTSGAFNTSGDFENQVDINITSMVRNADGTYVPRHDDLTGDLILTRSAPAYNRLLDKALALFDNGSPLVKEARGQGLDYLEYGRAEGQPIIVQIESRLKKDGSGYYLELTGVE